MFQQFDKITRMSLAASDMRLVGDATGRQARRDRDRKASVLRVHAIHEDVRFTPAMTKAVQAELEDLASWLGLSASVD